MKFSELLDAALELAARLEQEFPDGGEIGVAKWMESLGVEDAESYMRTMPGVVPFVGGLLAGVTLANLAEDDDE